MLPATLIATAAVGYFFWAYDGVNKIEERISDWIGESVKPSIPRQR